MGLPVKNLDGIRTDILFIGIDLTRSLKNTQLKPQMKASEILVWTNSWFEFWVVNKSKLNMNNGFRKVEHLNRG